MTQTFDVMMFGYSNMIWAAPTLSLQVEFTLLVLKVVHIAAVVLQNMSEFHNKNFHDMKLLCLSALNLLSLSTFKTKLNKKYHQSHKILKLSKPKLTVIVFQESKISTYSTVINSHLYLLEMSDS